MSYEQKQDLPQRNSESATLVLAGLLSHRNKHFHRKNVWRHVAIHANHADTSSTFYQVKIYIQYIVNVGEENRRNYHKTLEQKKL